MVSWSARLFGRELHLMPHGSPVPNAIAVKLHSHSLGIEVTEKYLNHEYVLPVKTLHFDFAEMEHAPLLFQPVPGFDQLLAKQALLGGARPIIARGREIALLGVFAHGAIGGELRS